MRRLNKNLEQYDWDEKPTFNTDMTETPWLKLAQIWLRYPIFLFLHFDFLHFDFLRLSHIAPNSCSSVSLISVSTVNYASHLYRSQLDRFDDMKIFKTTLPSRNIILNLFLRRNVMSISNPVNFESSKGTKAISRCNWHWNSKIWYGFYGFLGLSFENTISGSWTRRFSYSMWKTRSWMCYRRTIKQWDITLWYWRCLQWSFSIPIWSLSRNNKRW